MIIAKFSPFFPNSAFLIKKSCSESTAEKQGSLLLRGGVVGVSIGASTFGWFLGDFGWLLLVEGDFEWFQAVCCFSSYINLTAYRTLNSLLYLWLHVTD